MERLLLHIGYDGSKYSGWQFQPGITTVQGIIEEKLERIFHSPVTVFGCGRTDAGVHASQYMCHINLAELPSFDLKFRLNKNLPETIAVYDIIKLEASQHARYDAVSRTYDYFGHTFKAPVLYDYSSFYQIENLNFEAMKQAVALFTKYDDYRALCKQPDLHNHTICKVTHAQLYVDKKQERFRFSITANRFLRGMIRMCMSFVLKVGKGELTLAEFEHILANKIEMPDRQVAMPNGLYLSKVEYPYLSIAPHTNMCDMLKIGLE